MSTSTIPLAHGVASKEWSQPYHGTVAMLALIVAETAIFTYLCGRLYLLHRQEHLRAPAAPGPRTPDLQYRLPAVQ